MPFSRSISPQSTRRAQRLFKIFFLSVLCELCGELLCFLFDLTGRFFGRRLGRTLLALRSSKSEVGRHEPYKQTPLLLRWLWTIDTKRPLSFFKDRGHNTGDNLLSHPSVGALPSAVAGLTSVFEMGTCVSLHLWSPEWCS